MNLRWFVFLAILAFSTTSCTEKKYKDVFAIPVTGKNELFNRLALEYIDRAFSPGASEVNVQLKYFLSEPIVVEQLIDSSGNALTFDKKKTFLRYTKEWQFAQVISGTAYQGTIGTSIFDLDTEFNDIEIIFQREYFAYDDDGYEFSPEICETFGVDGVCPFGFNRDHPVVGQDIFQFSEIAFSIEQPLILLERFDFVGTEEYLELFLSSTFNTFFPFALGRPERYSSFVGTEFSAESPIRMAYYDNGLVVARLPGFEFAGSNKEPVWRMFENPADTASSPMISQLANRFLVIISPDPTFTNKGIILQEVFNSSGGTDYFEYGSFTVSDIGLDRGLLSYEIYQQPIPFVPGTLSLQAPQTIGRLLQQSDRVELGKVVEGLKR